jgi:hypothetical protein
VTAKVSVLAETNVAERVTPFQEALDDGVKFFPISVIVKPAPPTCELLGLKRISPGPDSGRGRSKKKT